MDVWMDVNMGSLYWQMSVKALHRKCKGQLLIGVTGRWPSTLPSRLVLFVVMANQQTHTCLQLFPNNQCDCSWLKKCSSTRRHMETKGFSVAAAALILLTEACLHGVENMTEWILLSIIRSSGLLDGFNSQTNGTVASVQYRCPK